MNAIRTMTRLIILAALVGVLVSGPVSATEHTIGLVCSWSAFGSEIETFSVNKKDKTVYWVNENKMLKIKDFNESRILMSGTKTRVFVYIPTPAVRIATQPPYTGLKRTRPAPSRGNGRPNMVPTCTGRLHILATARQAKHGSHASPIASLVARCYEQRFCRVAHSAERRIDSQALPRS